MSFQSRLIYCFAVPVALFVTAISVSLWGLLRTQDEFDRYIGTEQAIASGLTDMYAQGLQMGQAMRNIVLDPSNTKAFDNFQGAEKAYQEAYEATLKAASGTEAVAQLSALAPLRETLSVKQNSVLQMVKSDASSAMQALTKEETPAWRQLRSNLLDLLKSARQREAQAHERTLSNGRHIFVISAMLALVAIVVAGGLFWLMRRTVISEIGGEPAVAREMLQRIAEGDLTFDLGGEQNLQGLMGELRRTQYNLQKLVGQVRISTDSIKNASTEIATGNQDLSARTESAASNLQQTASSMEQLTGTVRQSAD
ncbi:MAG TPA: chemotaxis protein, partial [Aquabacterium sp.]|nr:chemotaxis protein [Aquabacterium sp.]